MSADLRLVRADERRIEGRVALEEILEAQADAGQLVRDAYLVLYETMWNARKLSRDVINYNVHRGLSLLARGMTEQDKATLRTDRALDEIRALRDPVA